MAVTVRRATPADGAAVAKFAVALFEMHADWDAKRFTQIATLEGAAHFYAGRTAKLRSAALATRIAKGVFMTISTGNLKVSGYVAGSLQASGPFLKPVLYAELATTAAWLHDIYVVPDSRSHGAGGALISAVRDEAKRLGANKVLLTVALGNTHGNRLFERSGFRVTMHEMMLEI